MHVGQCRIVSSTMLPWRKSIRSRDGGDPRDELDGFAAGEDVVIITADEYAALEACRNRMVRYVQSIDSSES